MAAKKTILLGVLCGFLLTFFVAGPVRGQSFPPTQEQEFLDAKAALEDARKAQAEKYADQNVKKAVAFMATAESARPAKDAVKFTQASRLARVYAELARATTELKIEEEKLAATQDELQKAKAEIERLKKGQ